VAKRASYFLRNLVTPATSSVRNSVLGTGGMSLKAEEFGIITVPIMLIGVLVSSTVGIGGGLSVRMYALGVIPNDLLPSSVVILASFLYRFDKEVREILR
jgi:hypothetical protein